MRIISPSALYTFIAISSLAISSDGFVPKSQNSASIRLHVSGLEKEQKIETEDDVTVVDEIPLYVPIVNIPNRLKISGKGVPNRKDKVQLIDTTTYEASLIKNWDIDPSRQKGFDWEIEKARRYAAGLRMREDGAWVKKPSLFEFLVSKHRINNGSITGPSPVNVMDVAFLFAVTILSYLGLGPAFGMAAVPTAVIQKYEGSMLSFITGVLGGDLQTMAGGPLFLLLNKYFLENGPIFNLSFGPKSFLVISDPVMAKHILRTAPADQYCKGMLADILEPIMGKGLIPADPATWKVRRRAVVPAFHKRWLKRMITLFNERAEILCDDLTRKEGTVIDMEERFCSVTLDIIGKAVFDYDFGSVTKESPIIKAVYRVLREAEHRSSSFIPYWNLPYADQWMGGQVEFRTDMTMLDDILAKLINRAVSTRSELTVEELEDRDNAEDPSLLRFLVDMRGEDVSSTVLRDDLMTMLIAGHETTAAMLTWTLFELAQGEPGMFEEIQNEVRTVLKDKDRPDYDDVVAMKKLRYALIEGLRLYPEPPVLIRRARTEDILPQGSSVMKDGIKVLRGTDIFVSTWNLHRSPELWENPLTFDPTRWERSFKNPNVKGWAGYDPDKVSGLYPSENAADFAFMPFGGGSRKCVGDQFAMLEAAVTFSVIIKNFNFEFEGSPEDVGMQTGATIHTMNGLRMRQTRVKKDDPLPSTDGWWEKQHLKRGLSSNGRAYQSKEEVEHTKFTEITDLLTLE
ncbi:cytochrome P450, carotenoid hydroxylase [Fragilariopsis cylindrus CCMP1102]|uniref:Cytochrome P450, carotenoid hydroxylase n=1 Tax=Fragilariopsis cylindrus CCMP1102 TaxID=635003 RepID=A0A1E7FD61_9STRA|nr:cytochrome P450, carotenoid hydroxylase [Fragilariopsis cylindrus CCMP1102]|eukprot:OEU16005.1 cytochrome P450, carotenoid hydroxylase [Fragilariopsis cylindrus CCMP1102]